MLKIHVFRIFSLLTTVSFLLFGCGKTSENIQLETTNGAHTSHFSNPEDISLSVIYGDHNRYCSFHSAQLNNNYLGSISYHGLSEVNLTVGNKIIPLENAIYNGDITVEEIIAQVRTDSQRGQCQESYTSELGLTQFKYRYSDFEIFYTDDVFEAPNGKQYLIQDLKFSQPSTLERNAPSLLYTDESGNSISLTREDWGITFEIVKAHTSGFHLNVTQTNGQHFGELVISDVSIFRIQDASKELIYAPDLLDENNPLIISGNASSQYIFDFTQHDFLLSKGTYLALILVNDNFDSSEMHDFLSDYTTSQYYCVTFTIS